MTPELHRPVAASRIGLEGYDLLVEADPAECAALAERMRIPAVLALSCRFHLRREGDSMVVARGQLRARVTQTCIVSLEDFDTDVAEDFQVRFVPSGEESDDQDPEADDEIPYEGDTPDLGEAAAEQLGLALDPYPRLPDAALPDIDPAPHPFAALAALRKRQPG